MGAFIIHVEGGNSGVTGLPYPGNNKNEHGDALADPQEKMQTLLDNLTAAGHSLESCLFVTGAVTLTLYGARNGN